MKKILACLFLTSCASAPVVSSVQSVCPAPKGVIIPLASKALFPDAPVIVNPTGQVNSVVAGAVIRASIENTKAHNKRINDNLELLREEQGEAIERQNADNIDAWKSCQTQEEQANPKKRFGLF